MKWSDFFGLDSTELENIVNFDSRNSQAKVDDLKSIGGVSSVAEKLKSSIDKGIYSSTIPASLKKTKSKITVIKIINEVDEFNNDSLLLHHRKAVFGSNVIEPPPPTSIYSMVWDNIMDDRIIQILIVGAFITLIIGASFHPSDGWIEGLAIFIAVIIVLSVTAINDYSKELKFRKLMLLQTEKKVKVIRNSEKDEISSWELVVGDLIELIPGDEIPSDGIYVSGTNTTVDESPLTGESVPVNKNDKSPFMFSGCQVSEGTCLMLVTAVGARSSAGKIQQLLSESANEETPLQTRLEGLAVQVGKLGMASGLLTFIGLAGRWIYDYIDSKNKGQAAENGGDIAQDFVRYFLTGITIVVVAVPEGLPLAVTVSLAFSMLKMIKDKCFVRHLQAAETMGDATCVCTDKTGTLTENKMKVVRLHSKNITLAGEGSGDVNCKRFSTESLPKQFSNLLAECVSVNSTCFIKNNSSDALPIFVGSSTEGALLVLLRSLGFNYEEIRTHSKYVPGGRLAFTSDIKRMATIVSPTAKVADHSEYRSYVKGAAEILLGLCRSILDPETMQISPMTEQFSLEIQERTKSWAEEGLRNIVLAFKNLIEVPDDLSENSGNIKSEIFDSDLVFVSLVGIKDPIRPDVPQAVSDCKRAGLIVRMVTGDNIITAKKIASECGILTSKGICMEGPEFRAMSEDSRRKIIPRLEVLARSSPSDKFILVTTLKEMGEIVAVTGDGTNDAPALKAANVGFSMGISGTQIAMNASDIVLTDDNFSSIVQSIKWGRNVLQVIKRFLQFQLAVNLSAILIVFLGSVVSSAKESPISTVQLLWINLIMDSFGALALASEDPEESILRTPPHKNSDPLISHKMIEYILAVVIYQVFSCSFTLLAGYQILGIPSTDVTRIHTIVFCTFVLLQITNEICCRQLNHELAIFNGAFRNPIFLGILCLIVVVQVILVEFGGEFAKCVPLSKWEWLYCILFAIGQLLYVILVRIFFSLYNSSGRYARRRKISPGSIALLSD